MTFRLPALVPVPKSGIEPLHDAGQPLGPTLLDFWRWSASDLVNNAQRGVLAEFIVAQLLGVELDVRTEWGTVDLETRDRLRVEVKSSAYVQSWGQHGLSVASFDVGPKRALQQETNEYAAPPERHADVYVFCLLSHADKATIDPLDLSHWQFFVLSARVIDRVLGAQKRANLRTIMRLGAVALKSSEVQSAVRQCTTVFAP